MEDFSSYIPDVDINEVLPTNCGKNWAAEEYVSSEYLVEREWRADGSWFKKILKEGIQLILHFDFANRKIKQLWLSNDNHPKARLTYQFYGGVLCESKSIFEYLLTLIQSEIEDALKPIEHLTIEQGANNVIEIKRDFK